jgi:uncharacterized protein YkwD
MNRSARFQFGRGFRLAGVLSAALALLVHPCLAAESAASRLEQRLVEKINRMRAEVGVAPLQLDPLLSRVAREHSEDMMRGGRVTDASPIVGRRTPEERYARAFGKAPGKIGENVAVTNPDFTEEMVALALHGQLNLSNEGFRHAVDPEVSTFGVGCVVGPDGRVWTTALFAQPAGTRSTLPPPTLVPRSPVAIPPALPPDPRPEREPVPTPAPPEAAPAEGSVSYLGELSNAFIESLRRRYAGTGDMHSATLLKINCSPLRMDLVPAENSVTIRPVVIEWVIQHHGPNYPAEPEHYRYELSFQPGPVEDGTGMNTDSRFYVPYQARTSYAVEAPGRPLQWKEDRTFKGSFEARSGDFTAASEEREPKFQKSKYTGHAHGLVDYTSDETFVLKALERFAPPASVATRPPPPPPVPAAPAPPAPPREFRLPPEVLQVDEDRAADIRWLQQIEDALRMAERKKVQARGVLVLQACELRLLRARIARLTDLLAKAPEGEPSSFLEAAFALAIEGWDRASGSPPGPGADQREFITGQIRALQAQVRDGEAEQEQLIRDTLETYYDTITEELTIRGPKSSSQDTREQAALALQDVADIKALATAELYLASGQSGKFREAAQACIARGRFVPETRFLEALHSLATNNMRQALEGFRRVVGLTSPAADEAPLTRTEAEAMSEGGDGLRQRARAMAWMIEHAYLQAIDAKASGNAAEIRAASADRLKQGGEEGWLGYITAHLKIGVVAIASEFTGREDALENLASSFQNDVAAQHCGLLLMQGLHEHGVALDAIDRLDNNAFLALMREHYGAGGAKLGADDALRLRAAVKAALANPDVKQIVSGAKLPLLLDTGRDYLDAGRFAETSLESWGNLINVGNIATMLLPGSTIRVGGKLAGVRLPGALGGSGGAVVTTAREAFMTTSGLEKLPAIFAETRAGQYLMKDAGRFFARSTWLEDRAVDMSVQLLAGETATAAGGTIGVLLGSDGKVEAEAGRMLADLFTSWGGDVDELKRLVTAHGIGAKQVTAVLESAERAGAAAEKLARDTSRVSTEIRRSLPAVPGKGITSEGRQLAQATKKELTDEYYSLVAEMQGGAPGADWFRRLGVFRTACDAIDMAADGGEAQVGAFLQRLEAEMKQAGTRAIRAEGSAAALREVEDAVAAQAPLGVSQRGPGASVAPLPGALPATAPAAPLSFRTGHPMAQDVDRLVVQRRYAAALAECENREALLKQMNLAKRREVAGAQFPEKIAYLRGVVEADARLASWPAPTDLGHARPVTADDLAQLERNPNIVKVPIETDPAKQSYSKPYWVMERQGNRLVKVGLFKGAGKDFPDGFDLRAEAASAQIGRLLGANPPACALAEMKIDGTLRRGLFVRYAPGAELASLGPGAPAVLKEQIARDIVHAAFLGDHDRRWVNMLVTGKNAAEPIDRGMANLTGAGYAENLSFATEADAYEAMKARILFLRRSAASVPLVHEQITIEDLLPHIPGVEALMTKDTSGAIEGVGAELKKILGANLNAAEADAASRVLPMRARVLERVLRDCFGTLKDLNAIPLSQVRPAARHPSVSVVFIMPPPAQMLALAA